MPKTYLFLVLAIVAETIGTVALPATKGFTRLAPAAVVVVAYGVSFYFLSLTVKVMPVGVVYAIWSGLGIVLIALMGFLLYNQRLDLPAVLGLGLILSGVLVLHLFSATTGH
ncbi:QacE family quaternary ammonium compound efflux SMR transporter [Vannielia litorea]|uniref:DMT family transporter n=1 Tax=Vannielia litorea TaxID=1217970 RepID=UPI001C987E44|nr:SMR family transporter [Vannielia litorea]MBY6153004.1 QacE family quaternary ammonium compound efflux SMR transporter [Vannielia litorea]